MAHFSSDTEKQQEQEHEYNEFTMTRELNRPAQERVKTRFSAVMCEVVVVDSGRGRVRIRIEFEEGGTRQGNTRNSEEIALPQSNRGTILAHTHLVCAIETTLEIR